MIYIVNEEVGRLDVFLAQKMDISRNQAAKMIKAHEVLVNQKMVKYGYIIKAGDEIRVDHVEE